MEKAKPIKTVLQITLCPGHQRHHSQGTPVCQAHINTHTDASQPSRTKIREIYAISLQGVEFLDYYPLWEFLTLRRSNDLVPQEDQKLGILETTPSLDNFRFFTSLKNSLVFVYHVLISVKTNKLREKHLRENRLYLVSCRKRNKPERKPPHSS